MFFCFLFVFFSPVFFFFFFKQKTAYEISACLVGLGDVYKRQQSDTAGRYRPAPGPRQSASLPPCRGARADQQPGRAGTPAGGDRPQGFPLLEEPTRRRSLLGFRQCDSDSHSGGRSIHHRLFAGSLLDSGVAIRVILLRSQPNPLPKTQSPRQTEGGLNLVAALPRARQPLINYKKSLGLSISSLRRIAALSNNCCCAHRAR